MRKLTISTLLVFIMVVIASHAHLALAGEIQQQLVQESTIEQVIKCGILRVGMSTFVPWAMKDKTGNLIGFEIDVAQQLGKDLGVTVEFIPTKWAGIIP